jgi:hypothetical protein
MKSRMRTTLIVASLVLVLGACTTVSFGTSDGKLRYDVAEPQYTVAGHFEVVVSDPTLIAGLIRLSDQDQNTDKFFKEQIAKFGGTAVRNVNMKYGVGIIDVLLTSITSGIWAPRTMTISGDVVK